jgi:erythromycin esterase
MARRQWREPTDRDADRRLIEAIRSVSSALYGWEDLDPLLERIGNARYVLLGEASHGTAEFYNWRRSISQRLIAEKGFSFIAVEGDWPDCYRVNRYVKDYPEAGATAREALDAFERWPTWMWANEEVVGLVEWLRDYNQRLPAEGKAGFYGLDVYSLWDSMNAVLGHLEMTDGSAAAAARRALECFEPYSYDVQEYARATAWMPDSCEDEIVEMLGQMRKRVSQPSPDDHEGAFSAEQNALVAKNAERYYRTMVRGDSPSWNVRDRHMVETLNRLMDFHGQRAKAIVWEHNTHIGDARFTDMAESGMVNVGQLVREQHEADGVVLVGFSSYQGTVIAADAWGAQMERMRMPPGRAGSWEDLLHRAEASDRLLLFDRSDLDGPIAAPRGHRAIGVVYRPQHEAYGNYVPTLMPRRYDALAYFNESHALHPLRMPVGADRDLPQTFPSGV